MSDLSEFPKPPRHPEDFKRELEKLSGAVTEAMFENDTFMDFATKFPEEYAYQIGEAVAMQLGSLAQELKQSLIEGYDFGVEEAEEMLEENEEE